MCSFGKDPRLTAWSNEDVQKWTNSAPSWSRLDGPCRDSKVRKTDQNFQIDITNTTSEIRGLSRRGPSGRDGKKISLISTTLPTLIAVDPSACRSLKLLPFPFIISFSAIYEMVRLTIS